MRYVCAFSLVMLLGNIARAQEGFPPPAKDHDWLKQFAGAWEADAEVTMEPGKPPIKAKGFENNRLLGGFWMISEVRSEIQGITVQANFTLGYDPEKKKYVGTWIDSMTSILWKYEGELDSTGKVLTLFTEGPLPDGRGKIGKFKEIHEFKNADHRTFTASYLGEDGKWKTLVKSEARRKK